jgi:hypothetical protein
MELGYDEYRQFIEVVVDSKELGSFKRNRHYTPVLEHVSRTQGQLYYDLCRQEFTLSDEAILAFCRVNDSFGNPVQEVYAFGQVSPSSLRYVYHSHVILKYLSFLDKKNYTIVEVGGGYGGLAMAILFYSTKFNITIDEYNICDLDVVVKLQELCIRIACINPSIFKYHDAITYGSTILPTNLFLISCYAFSEIDSYHQRKYLDILFPKITNGFIIWNTPYYDFGRKTYIVDERPQTHPEKINKFIYF